MTSKERIEEMKIRESILKCIKELIDLFPEQRVGQIIFNYICAKCNNKDPFFIQDTNLLKILQTQVEEIKEKQRQREIRNFLNTASPEEIKKLWDLIKK